MAHEEAMTDGERCGFPGCGQGQNNWNHLMPFGGHYFPKTINEQGAHRIFNHPFQPSLSARETAEVRTNPASGDRPDTVTHTPGLGTSASKRADNLLPLWCLLGPFQPSLFARETAVAVMPNPLCAGSAGCSENGATPASKRADNLLPLWCLPALVPP